MQLEGKVAIVTGAGQGVGQGIALAYATAKKHFVANGVNRVILATDGDFNVGPSSDAALLEFIEDKRKTGITLTVLGFGVGNLNDSMMEKISNAGNGFYAMISSKDQAERYVENRMLATMVLIAKDMKIQIEFNPAKVAAYRLIGYENRMLKTEDFDNDAKDNARRAMICTSFGGASPWRCRSEYLRQRCDRRARLRPGRCQRRGRLPEWSLHRVPPR